MGGHHYGTSDDGKYEIVSLTPDKLKAALEVMRKSFFVDENLAKAVELTKYPKAMDELAELTAKGAEDGCSLIAVEKSTGNIAAVAFTKFQFPKQPHFYKEFVFNCKEPAAKTMMDYMYVADEKGDLFKLCKTDCILEIMFTATLKEHRGKGLSTKLAGCVVALSRKLLAGENVKVSMNGEKLDLHPVPKAVSAVFTTFITQKVGARVGFKKAYVYGFEDWSFNGKKFEEMIGPQTPYSTVEYFVL